MQCQYITRYGERSGWHHFSFERRNLMAPCGSCAAEAGRVVLVFVATAFPSDPTLTFACAVSARCREQHRDGFFHAIFTVYNHRTNSSKMPQTK